jgi:hypothetical protein
LHHGHFGTVSDPVYGNPKALSLSVSQGRGYPFLEPSPLGRGSEHWTDQRPKEKPLHEGRAHHAPYGALWKARGCGASGQKNQGRLRRRHINPLSHSPLKGGRRGGEGSPHAGKSGQLPPQEGIQNAAAESPLAHPPSCWSLHNPVGCGHDPEQRRPGTPDEENAELTAEELQRARPAPEVLREIFGDKSAQDFLQRSKEARERKDKGPRR